jgi:hypothetical protein
MKWFHRHLWKVTAVTHLERIDRWAAELHLAPDPCTEVLLVCDCGSVKTFTISGHWTAAQMQPHPDKPEADKPFLRKLGGKI